MKAEYVDCEMNLEVERGGDIYITNRGELLINAAHPEIGFVILFPSSRFGNCPAVPGMRMPMLRGDRYTDCSLGTATSVTTAF